jgi:hypothetical protein
VLLAADGDYASVAGILVPFNRDFPFDLMISTPARHTVNNKTIGTAISTLLATETANEPGPKAPQTRQSAANAPFWPFFDAP